MPSLGQVNKRAHIRTINGRSNQLFYNYLSELKRLTGCGVTMKTSFNVKGEPMVYGPVDALRTFYGSGLDSLVIGNFVLNK